MPHDAYFDVAMATALLPVSFCCKSNAACLTVWDEMIHPILSIWNVCIVLALLTNLLEVDSVCSRSNTGVTII